MSSDSWRGYVFSRPTHGYFVPHRVQNLVIRTYTEKKGKRFLLSVTEYYMDECYMILESLLEDLSGLGAVVFYNTHMLPKSKEFRQTMYEKLFKAECELHFALEELSITKREDVQLIEDILLVRDLAPTLDAPASGVPSPE